MTEENVNIRREEDRDRQAVCKVHWTAFGGNDEARLVDALREGGFVAVSLVAEAAEEVIGHILFSRICIRTATGVLEAVSLAPMAVLPERQRQGVGGKLVEAGLNKCRQDGHRMAVVLGHPQFYLRFGFSPQLARRLQSPFGGGDAWMALELTPNALLGVEGRVEYSPPFRMFE